MKEWFTAAEIGKLALPGLPASERTNQLRAGREGWKYRAREGRGGGREYAFAALPADARAAYVAREMAALDVPIAVARVAATELAAETAAPTAIE